MRATVITEHGGPEVLQIQELPDPVGVDGEILIRVKAFGVNHAETHMRKGEWPESTPVSGIEAVGSVVRDPSGRLAEGTGVLTIMAVWAARATAAMPSTLWHRPRMSCQSRPP
jgi:NADPH:quinone reductase-like Zn-dependent oxidoreductase